MLNGTFWLLRYALPETVLRKLTTPHHIIKIISNMHRVTRVIPIIFMQSHIAHELLLTLALRLAAGQHSKLQQDAQAGKERRKTIQMSE